MGKRKTRSSRLPRVGRKTPVKPPRSKTPAGPGRVKPPSPSVAAGVPGARAQPGAPEISVRPPRGLGLGTKFAFLVAVLISVVALVWGVVLYNLFEGVLTDQIMMEGTQAVKTLAIAGATMLAQDPDQRGKISLGRLIEIAPGVSSDIAAAAIFDQDGVPVVGVGDFEDRREGAPVRWKATSVRIKEGSIRRGKIPVRFFYAEIKARGNGGPLRRLGEAMVAIDWRKVSKKTAWVVQMIVFSGVLFVAIGVAASVVLGRTVTQPVHDLMRDMEIVSRGNFDHVTRATSSDEIGRLALAFSRMTRALNEAEERRKVTEELEDQVSAAMEIQANLLPNKIPQIPGFDIYPYWRSAREVGGDYYDFIPVDRERLAFVVADVSGKGVPGSMVMATTRTILHMVVLDNPSPSDILMKTNAVVAREIRRGMFVTAMLAILDVRKRELIVCSAGHNPMVVYRHRTGKCELINPNGIALGFDKGPVFNRTLQEKPVKFSSGDRVVLYTDGVVEAMNPQHEEFGDERLYRFVQRNPNLSSKEFVTLLVKTLDEHKGSAEQHDDITISTFRVE